MKTRKSQRRLGDELTHVCGPIIQLHNRPPGKLISTLFMVLKSLFSGKLKTIVGGQLVFY